MKIRVGIVFGGMSVEHEVSIISALQLIESADKEKYDFVPIYISKKGKWFSGDHLKDIKNYKDLDKLQQRSDEVLITSNFDDNFLYIREGEKIKKLREIDIFFPVLHGGTGEDGCIQGLFELKGSPYVNNDVISSAISMNKLQVKKVLMTHHIPTVEDFTLNDKNWFGYEEERLKEIIAKLKLPLVVKPVNLGSSIGISFCSDQEELYSAIDNAFIYTNEILIEKAIQNLVEVNCSVLGDKYNQQVSEIEEPLTSGAILSYEDKYMSNADDKEADGMASLSRIIPARISDELRSKIENSSKKAFEVLGCEGVVRIDFLIDSKSQEYYLNEINAIPGSLAFYLWEPIGLEYKKLIDKLIDIGFQRWYKKQKYTITTNYNLFNIVGGKKSGD